MTETVMRSQRVDRNRVYVIGMSAGAYEASILGATYPSLYAAIGIHSGAAYMDGLACVDGARASIPTPVLARAALRAMATHARVMPVIVIHGDQDERVPYRCGRQALAQWLATDNLVRASEGRPPIADRPAAIRTAHPRGRRSYTVESYGPGHGCPVAELWTVHGMGHAWSGGTRAAALALYSDPLGPSAAAASVGWLLRWNLAGVCSTS
jgi:poly(3-hydroxybutyrate) depolymerase